MNLNDMKAVAKAMVGNGKGILVNHPAKLWRSFSDNFCPNVNVAHV